MQDSTDRKYVTFPPAYEDVSRTPDSSATRLLGAEGEVPSEDAIAILGVGGEADVVGATRGMTNRGSDEGYVAGLGCFTKVLEGPVENPCDVRLSRD